tara:strand:- start:54 stop:449 length:396 start_codon:yes stop_codon:yes gene_type:complete
MPVATVNPDISQQRYELKTCEGGFVVLRQLSYGEQIKKQQMAAKMTFEGQGRGFSGGEFEFFQRKVTEFEFATCIVEHNLEDTEGKELSFASSNTIDKLDPRVGSEIAHYISEMNDFQEEVDFLAESSGRP